MSHSSYSTHYSQLAFAWSGDRPRCDIRVKNADFFVEEQLSFTPSGEGEHLFLFIEKTGANTDWIAQKLAKLFEVQIRDIGYAGKKDRHAVTRQWFSVYKAGCDNRWIADKIEAWSELDSKILLHTFHQKKLRKGSIKLNRFNLVLRNLEYPLSDKLIETIAERGVPNYFGPQRFGREYSNLDKVESLVERGITAKRKVKSIWISAARSFLFNLQLSSRVKHNNWQRALAGDCFGFPDSASFFKAEESSSGNSNDELQSRLNRGEITISGWLPGQGKSNVSAQAAVLESKSLENFTHWIEWLDKMKVKSARRGLTLRPGLLKVEPIDHATVQLSFSLNSGGYATSLLRELVNFRDCSQRTMNSAGNEELPNRDKQGLER